MSARLAILWPDADPAGPTQQPPSKAGYDAGQTTLGQLFAAYQQLELPKLCADARKQMPPLWGRFTTGLGGPGRTAGSIKRIEINLWLAANKGSWKSAWTVKGVISRLGRVFAWGVQNDLVEKNPFFRFPSDAPEVNTRPIEQAEFLLLMRSASVRFKRLLLFLRRTGCRPGEAHALRWNDIDFERKIAVLAKHKTSKKTGKPRVIALPAVIVDMLRWMERQPRTSETVFQNADGGQWNRHSFAHCFRRLAKRVGLPLECRPYCCRHGFATEAIAGGEDLLLVSRLLGHSNTKTTERHYLHLDQRTDLLTDAVENAQKFLVDKPGQPGR